MLCARTVPPHVFVPAIAALIVGGCEEDIAAVVKRRMEALGFDPTAYAGHSLRSGAARTAGSIGDAQTLLNHKSESTTRQFYADQEVEKIAAAVRHDQRLQRK